MLDEVTGYMENGERSAHQRLGLLAAVLDGLAGQTRS